jgi:hypothetical protein
LRSRRSIDWHRARQRHSRVSPTRSSCFIIAARARD